MKRQKIYLRIEPVGREYLRNSSNPLLAKHASQDEIIYRDNNGLYPGVLS